MRVLAEFLDGPRECNYLKDQTAILEYLMIAELSESEYEDLMHSNFRKFGNFCFRPVCLSCQRCQPLRVIVKDFTVSRSMKRCIKINQDLSIETSRAEDSPEVIELFNTYHALKAEKREWENSVIDRQRYFSHFLESSNQIEQLALYKGHKLLGIMLFETLPYGISLIYHFYDQREELRSLGTMLILKSIDLAKELGKQFVYLGYFVAGCSSMEYKANFKPNQLLRDGIWLDFKS